MEEVKRGRGRPRKETPPQLPQEIQSIVLEVLDKQKELQQQIIKELPIQEEIHHKEGEWDVKIGDPIEYFDKRLSYELTGYRPITETKGLDFKPEWFTEARETYLKTGKYCSWLPGSKMYRDFWNEEYRRCKYGLTINGYTITGFNYYFLNYYQLPNTELEKAGDSRTEIFPNFFVYQYEFFHYFELCRTLRYNLAVMKNRGCGASEMNASIFDCFFNCFKNSICLLTAYDGNYVTKTLDKIWNGISFTDDHTLGGMLKLRLVVNTATKKRATYYKVVNGQKIEVGFGSLIEGIIVDKDRKMRGDRVGLLFLEESGSNPILETSFIKAEELCTVGGNKIGVIVAVGTGGDEGPALEGLNKVYYNPKDFQILPFKHNYTETEEWVETAYFMPAYITMNKKGYVGSRGEYIISKQKEYYLNRRANISDPQTLLKHKAEQCFTAEEAFAAEGVNKFNKIKISDLIIRLRVIKDKPKIMDGYMLFIYKGPGRDRNDIVGVKFVPKLGGPVHILLPPLWELTNGDREPGESEEDYNARQKEVISKVTNLYVGGIDGIDIGMDETSALTKDPSKFCTVIKRRIYGMKEPMYVAYYLDRPNDIRDAYIQTIGLLMWYNCQANLEATRTSILTYARDNKFMLYFMKRPRVCSGDINNRKRINNLYGTTATVAMIDHQTDLIRDYVEDFCLNIWFLLFLEQLNLYTDENKRKFDIIAALGMCEIADEELHDIVPKKTEPASSTFQDIGFYYENGIKKFGIIPKLNKYPFTAGEINRGYIDGYNITSNARYR